MANSSKLESRIKFDSPWSLTIQDDLSGPTAISIPAGEYYHSSVGNGTRSLLGEIAYQANAVMTRTWAVTLSSTGVCSLSATGVSLAVTWTSTDLRDVLGFSGSEVVVDAVVTASAQCKGLWLSDYPYNSLHQGGSWKGSIESDMQIAESSRGDVYAISGQIKRALNLSFAAEASPKTWVADEILGNTSFEQFYLDCILGNQTWANTCGPIRWYPDYTDDTTYGTYSILLKDWNPSQLSEGWTGRWTIALPRLVEVPS